MAETLVTAFAELAVWLRRAGFRRLLWVADGLSAWWWHDYA